MKMVSVYSICREIMELIGIESGCCLCNFLIGRHLFTSLNHPPDSTALLHPRRNVPESSEPPKRCVFSLCHPLIHFKPICPYVTTPKRPSYVQIRYLLIPDLSNHPNSLPSAFSLLDHPALQCLVLLSVVLVHLGIPRSRMLAMCHCQDTSQQFLPRPGTRSRCHKATVECRIAPQS